VSAQNLNPLTCWLPIGVGKTTYCYAETDTYQGRTHKPDRKKKWREREKKKVMKETEKKEQIRP